ncbi:hypothetical protein [Methylobacterium oryzae]|uniref:hypothetical protein n=1 Tax=Methylobacterium oryzae TaxID=334852 RepID=UPI002F2F2A68
MTEQEKAHLYRGMTSQEVEAHEDWVRRYKAERSARDAEAVVANAKRRVDLRGMDDGDVVREAIMKAAPGAWDHDSDVALQVLRDAGFVRRPDTAEPLRDLAELTHQSRKGDREEAHMEADQVLCGILSSLGLGDVVDAYHGVQKWWA